MLNRLGSRRREVVVGAALGEDAAALDLNGEAVVLSSDPITGASRNAGWYAVHVACNDIAAMGAEPIGVLATLLLPCSANEGDLVGLLADVHRAATELGIEIMGGHTEVTSAVVSPLIAMTAVGKAPRDRLLASAAARPGQTLVLTGAAGLEGTAILASDFKERLRERLPSDLIERAQSFVLEISVVKDGLLAAQLGASALHDPTEGGVLGAVWELAEAANCGYEIVASAIPVRLETRAICEELGMDPLKLISSGAMLAATSQPDRLVNGLAAAGIPAAIIGRLVQEPGGWLVGDGGRSPVGPVDQDELYRFLEASSR